MTRSCISCGAPARCLGPLPPSNLFAGRALPDPLPGGDLYRCDDCRLGFRYPRPAKGELDALYTTGSDSSWTWEAGDRKDWALAARALQVLKPDAAQVADIGCFDGTFLASLGPDITKSGIEILPAAAAAARAKGVDVIAPDFESLAHTSRRFDAITAFDVIEHVEDPLAFLSLLASVLRPNGVIIVSTGNLDAWSWALMRNRYWYCAIPEHISFLSVRWFEHAAHTLGLEIAGVTKYAHAQAPVARRMYETAANFTYLVCPSAIAALRRRGIGNVSQALAPDLAGRYPPGWFTAEDHVLVALRPASRDVEQEADAVPYIPAA